MSALGQKQTLADVRVMSALPPKADIGTQPRDVRFVPKADIARCAAAKSGIERNEGREVHKGQCGRARLAQALLKAQNLLG